MSRLGYQVLGFAVWNGAKLYLRRRYGDLPRRLAIGAILGSVLAVALLAQRKAANSG